MTSASETVATGSAGFDLRAYRLFAFTAFPVNLLWTHLAIGVRAEHVLLTVGFMFLFAFSERTIRFAVLVLPFLLVGITYDNFRLIIDYRAAVDVADLYYAELAWFGIDTASGRIVPPDYFLTRTYAVLDFVCGAAYLLYLVEVVAFGIYLFVKDHRGLSRFAWSFLLVNILGMITWMAYPAAPPWYVHEYGLGPAVLDAAPSPAGALRFDALIGADVFAGFYARNANVFGAMPSLHCAYPTLVVLGCWKRGWALRVASITFVCVVAFSAVYLSHHYVLDVIAGVAYGAIAYGAVTWIERRWSR